MSTVLLTIYTLMWPVMVAVIMFVLARGFYRDWREARRQGVDLV